MKLISILAVTFAFASCTSETSTPQSRAQVREVECQIRTMSCPLKAGDKILPADVCVKFLVVERAEGEEASSWPAKEPQQIPASVQSGEGGTATPDAGTANPVTNAPPVPSKEDRLLQECMPQGDESALRKKYKEGIITGVSPTSPEALKQMLIEAEDAMRECAPILSKYESWTADMRARDFPTSTADPTEAGKLSIVLVLSYARALLAAAEIKEIPSPGFFCFGECWVRGRQHLVDDLLSQLELNDWGPERVKAGLTIKYLVKLRKRGVHEFYQIWALAKVEDDMKSSLREYLCQEIENKTAAGLDAKEITALNCHPDAAEDGQQP